MVGIAIVYLAINFISTKLRGRPVYHFLTWDDFSTIQIATGIVVGALLVYNLIVSISEVFKGRTSQAKSKFDKFLFKLKQWREYQYIYFNKLMIF